MLVSAPFPLFIVTIIILCVHAKSLQLCLTLCNLTDHSPGGSSVHGVLQARKMEWVSMPSSRGSSQPRDWTSVFLISCVVGRFFATEPPGKQFSSVCFYFFFKYIHRVVQPSPLSNFYVSKFGKLSSGHRTGKGQFSFQSQRRAMPKNVQITVQLCSFHMLAGGSDGKESSCIAGYLGREDPLEKEMATHFGILA